MITRYAICALIETQPDLSVMGTVGNCSQCCRMALELAPDVLLCDLETEEHCKSECLSVVRSHQPDLPTVVMHEQIRDQRLKGASRLGIQGYLTMDTNPDSLFTAIRIVSEGGVFLDQSLQARVMSLVNDTHKMRLTAREHMVLRLIAEGKNNQHIADSMFMSKSNVKRYISTILRKLDASNRTQAVTIARTMGLF